MAEAVRQLARGDLWHTCVIEEKDDVTAVDALGALKPVYGTTAGTRRCRVEYVSGAERMRAGTIQSTVDVKISFDYFDVDLTKHRLNVTNITTNQATVWNIEHYDHVFDRGHKTVCYRTKGTQ